MSKQIHLRGKHGATIGNYAIVDDEDFDRINQYIWYVRINTSKNKQTVHKYAVAKINDIGFYMHRMIMNVTDRKVYVDHKDRDTFNNQKSNLRLCTNSQNVANGRKRQRPVTGCKYKGVQQKIEGKIKNWRAFITINYNHRYLGSYKTAKEAAIAYDIAAIKEFGEFASLNFPNTDYSKVIPPKRIGKREAKIGHRYITKIKHNTKPYEFNLYHNKKRYRKHCATLEEAIEYKKEVLKITGRDE